MAGGGVWRFVPVPTPCTGGRDEDRKKEGRWRWSDLLPDMSEALCVGPPGVAALGTEGWQTVLHADVTLPGFRPSDRAFGSRR